MTEIKNKRRWIVMTNNIVNHKNTLANINIQKQDWQQNNPVEILVLGFDIIGNPQLIMLRLLFTHDLLFNWQINLRSYELFTSDFISFWSVQKNCFKANHITDTGLWKEYREGYQSWVNIDGVWTDKKMLHGYVSKGVFRCQTKYQ